MEEIMSNQISQVTAVVKWFNQFKGYGFVSVDNVPEDIFLHFSVLEKSSVKKVNNNDVILCTIANSDRGYQVVSIEKIIEQAKYSTDDMAPFAATGIVKWFNPLKGFGFAQLADGHDVFMHASLLRKNGITDIKPGTNVTLTIRNTNFGYEALDIHVD